jgi:hypothetical protein
MQLGSDLPSVYNGLRFERLRLGQTGSIMTNSPSPAGPCWACSERTTIPDVRRDLSAQVCEDPEPAGKRIWRGGCDAAALQSAVGSAAYQRAQPDVQVWTSD